MKKGKKFCSRFFASRRVLLAALLLLAFAVLLSSCSSGGADPTGSNGGEEDETPNLEREVVIAPTARVSVDGEKTAGGAYIPLDGGEGIAVEGSVKKSSATRDGKHIVVLEDDGTLYCATPDLSQKTVISENGDDYSYIRNDGFYYTVMGQNGREIYRALFSDGSSVPLQGAVSVTCADNSLSAIYRTADKRVYCLPDSGSEPVLLKARDPEGGDVIALVCSDKGDFAAWTQSERIGVSTVTSLSAFHDGAGEELATITPEAFSVCLTYTEVSKGGYPIFLFNNCSESLWIKSRGEEMKTVNLGAKPDGGKVYTSSGRVIYNDTKRDEKYYIAAESGDVKEVLRFTRGGETGAVVTGIDDFVIASNSLFYTDTEGKLYYIPFEDGAFRADKKVEIARDVFEFTPAQNGKYVYFVKDCDDDADTASLYCYKTGAEEPVPVSDKARCVYYGGLGIAYMKAVITTDGGSVLYLENAVDTGVNGIFSGDLMMKSYDGEPRLIARGVWEDSVNDGTNTGEVPKDGFWFKQSDGEKTSLAYFNGSSAAEKSAVG